jgi:hypothetical protein
MSRLLALAAALLVARLLGKASYGELGIVQSTIVMFGTLAGFGMGTTAAKFVAEFRHSDPVRAGKSLPFERRLVEHGHHARSGIVHSVSMAYPKSSGGT